MRKLSLKIGNLELKHGIMLAPMAGVTDRAYRKICRKHGAELTYTEMVSSKALKFNDGSSIELGSLKEGEVNTAIQVFGHEPDIISESIIKLTKPRDGYITPVAVDINMGCPMKKIVNNGDGSSLMRNPELVGKIVSAARNATRLPLTIKIRCGWDSNSINAPLIAKIAEENGADAIIVHGRTREQMYCTDVNRQVIADVKKSVSIPVIANGGIFTLSDAISMLDQTGCDGLMLARGTMGNPWLFDEIISCLDGTTFSPPTLEEKLNEALTQAKEMILDKGERTGVLEARRQVAYYIKNVRGSSQARASLNSASSYDQIQDIISQIIKSN